MAIGTHITKVLTVTFWGLTGAGVLILLIAAIRYRNGNTCKGIRITITNRAATGPVFIGKKDIAGLLGSAIPGAAQDKPIRSFDLHRLESGLEKNVWIKDAELFFDNNDMLQVRVTEREPAARVFTRDGGSCFIDSNGAHLPLVEGSAANLPVFTDYPYPLNKIALHGEDSALTAGISHLGSFIRADSFWSAQIAQIVITPRKTFELIPETGSHRIIFGDGDEIPAKFHRLALFYREVLSRTVMDKYESIDVSWSGQVVATKASAGQHHYDSLQAMNNIRQMIRSAQQLQPDTLRQQHIRPLEQNTMTEQNLNNFDLVPDAGDSSATVPRKQASPPNRPRASGSPPTSGKPRAVMPRADHRSAGRRPIISRAPGMG
jgi:cell division protein FtsQ